MRLTVSQTMTLGVAAATLLSLLLIVGSAASSMRKMAVELTETRMQKTADLAALMLTDAIISDDLGRIDSTIDTILNSDYGVRRMCVFDQQDRRLSHGRCSQVDETPAPGSRIAEAAVVVGGVSHGHVGVAYDPWQNYPDLEDVERKMFLLSVGALSLTILTTFLIGRTFRREVALLHTEFDLMAEAGELRPLRQTPLVELQRITTSFNDLIEKRQRDKRGH